MGKISQRRSDKILRKETAKQEIPVRRRKVYKHFTEQDNEIIFEALHRHGKDAYQIQKLLPTRTIQTIYKKLHNLKLQLEDNPDSKRKDLIRILNTTGKRNGSQIFTKSSNSIKKIKKASDEITNS